VATHVAFLRGINVGGHRVSSASLAAHVETTGLEEVSCFRASGNVIFDAGSKRAGDIPALIEEALREALGYEVPVFLRSAKEVAAVAKHEPFGAEAAKASKGKLQVLFLAKKPGRAAAEKALALATDQDRLALKGSELYWLPSGGILDSELDRKTLDAALGVATMRTKGTVEQIAAKLRPG